MTRQVKAAEDILSLTRVLKETWLFGKLQTVGTSRAEEDAEAAAEKVAAGLARLTAKREPAASSRGSEGINEKDIESPSSPKP